MKNIGNIVIVVVSVIAIGAVVVLVGYFTDWFGLNKQTTLSLSINGKNIENGTSGLTLSRGSEIIITSDTDYTITIKAYATDNNDFAFSVGDEPYTWKDLDGRDMSEAFTITDNVIMFGSIESIISSVLSGYSVYVFNELRKPEDIFELIVKSEKMSLSVLFTITNMILDPDHIVF